ncbi:right-handed parallel beta-helix repeat-containing protein [Actinomadura barringtoniae]|uniref:Right-handed parallel beta-helix repeat-containing protein n=1 Tax=Actinomadura barringtoniae TaxID=1427535 RepID=A0A939T7N9_9ACTN|nr:right-handed parallel beta-helix repeat-containing protein [Actinomadura barringtoniae]MBO2446065.1 right-handed parallel beta-helix repeat-containing protein [Actinomadura barringtoniae]
MGRRYLGRRHLGKRHLGRLWLAVAAAFVLVLGLVVSADAHIERPSYWPLPGPDCSVSPCAGGKVPTARSLASSIQTTKGSTTRVVCRPDSLKRLDAAIKKALRSGYNLRPHDHRRFTQAEAKELRRVNKALAARCTYGEIQPAVTASGNNDRVVVLPGLYTEPTARAKPTHDPACDKYKLSTGAYSYLGEYNCQNDANLIAVLGRTPGPGKDPDPPLVDRHGIPNRGSCVRCNLQLEGSGVSADDVIVEAGDARSGNHGPRNSAKDVGIRADRADGFVLRNVTVRHAEEHDIYVLESNGYLLDRFKTFYAGEYGVLTFVEDHGVMQNCEAVGNGDSGLYPGSGAKTSAGRDPKFYPTARYSQEIRYCDSHHNASGYSGTDGSGTWLHNNNFYDNGLGFTTDVFTAAGHPGFPQQGDLIENNDFFNNNFNPYLPTSDVVPTVPVPVGTGMWIAGGDDNVVRNNRFRDNHRRGAMLFAVPDAFVCGDSPMTGCDPLKLSTSHRNSFYGNKMSGNGVDFWWDAFPGNVGNCWYGNGKATSSPSPLPDCLQGKAPWLSFGFGNIGNEAELLTCMSDLKPGGPCPWFTSPPVPAKPKAATAASDGDHDHGTGELNDALLAIVTCDTWHEMNTDQRNHMLGNMQVFMGGQIDHPGARGTTLTAQQATGMLNNACGLSFSGPFKLYKLYARAAAFMPRLQRG